MCRSGATSDVRSRRLLTRSLRACRTSLVSPSLTPLPLSWLFCAYLHQLRQICTACLGCHMHSACLGRASADYSLYAGTVGSLATHLCWAPPCQKHHPPNPLRGAMRATLTLLTPAGDKYSVFLIPDPERLELSDGQQQPQQEKAAFRIVPSKYAVPAQAPRWQLAIAVLLFVFAAGTSFQTGLVANTATLPQVRSLHRKNGGQLCAVGLRVIELGVECLRAEATVPSSLLCGLGNARAALVPAVYAAHEQDRAHCGL